MKDFIRIADSNSINQILNAMAEMQEVVIALIRQNEDQAKQFKIREEQYRTEAEQERLRFMELLHAKDKEQSRKIDELHKVIISKPTKKAVSLTKEQLKAKWRTEDYSN